MRPDHPVLRVIRVFLAMVFLTYGVTKLLGGQFIYNDWTLTRSTVNGPSLVWAFFGYSPIYARFVGLCELIPAMLLLFPRTAFLGAAALFPVVLNITVMNFTYGFPSVKYMALLYTALCALLVWVEREKVLIFLQPIHRVRAALAATETVAASAPAPFVIPRAGRTILWAAGVLLAAFMANLVAESASDGPEVRALAAARRATNRDDLVVMRARYTGLYAVGRTAQLEIGAPHDSASTIRVFASRTVGFTPWKVDSVAR